ncbi:hypothetical protein AWB81_07578 [Caballeronia arationis]|jgi:hypothetical protein|uniref:DNA primase n=1 Tax=Caballeronia arationis TaxID=1777142 RepID=A0A7Z7N478_9BURK|nr:hypothetical protein [Caballeronia arationis]SAL06413.1 hypothetical protein AWB81_07578 [Caballeronia arationis]SOE80863.1 hypothetical protein SAMN05446927_4115 [Caballeronia arationis]
MSADTLLNRLEGVREVGPGRYVARCPAHEDRQASLSITEKPDGVLLVHCFAGCAIAEVVGALGLDLADLFPPRESGAAGLVRSGKPVKRRWSAAQILAALTLELCEIVLVIGAIARRGAVTPTEYDRLLRSVQRVMHAEGYCSD